MSDLVHVTQGEHLLKKLTEFYTENPAATEELVRLLDRKRKDPARVSLRVLDWLVTNFAKLHRITYEVNSQPVSLFEAYKDELHSFTKQLFDPFGRKEDKRFSIKFNETMEPITTTCSQLNFIAWCIRNRVLDYARTHLPQIQSHMNECIRKRKADRERARRDGSENPKRSMITKGPKGAAKIQHIQTVHQG